MKVAAEKAEICCNKIFLPEMYSTKLNVNETPRHVL